MRDLAYQEPARDYLLSMIKRKICLVIPSLQAGGMERVMSELAGYMASDSQNEIHLVLYDSTREIFYPVAGGIIVHQPDFAFKHRLKLPSTLRTMYFLRKTVADISPTTFLSFGELWNSFVMISLIGLNVPVYISDRCSPVKRFDLMHDILRRLFYPRSKGIIVQTSLARDIYTKQFRHKNIRVIGNPIRSISSDIENRENIVLTVGRFIKSKNHDRLIEMFIDIELTGWKLVLIGYDHLGQSNSNLLQQIINRRSAKDRVLLLGKQSDVDYYYRKSKIFAFTSDSEGFPNVIGEAMSAGLPVVAFDCMAGPSEMISNDINGYLIPLYDYDSFRNKLESLMKDEELRTRLGGKAREDIKRFAIDKVGKEYLDFVLESN